MGLSLFAAISCTEKTTEEIADVISLSRSSVAFAEEGGSTTVSVASPSQWNANCPDSWVTLEPKDGLLTISTDNNATGDVRNSTITLKSGTDEHQISVHQAYSRNAVHLSLSASEAVTFDSEGDKCIFTVLTNGKWEASSEASWLTIARNETNATLTISASQNPDPGRAATVIITSTDGKTTATRQVAVAQISRDENNYFKILGYYGLYAQNWYYDSKSLGVGGTGSFCTIEQNEYGKSFFIKDLFVKGTVIDATYDRRTGLMSIELGRRCLVKDLSPTQKRSYYVMMTNVDARKFHGGTLAGTLGKGLNDDGVERKAVLLSGFEANHKGLGIICADTPGQYAYISDLFYAAGTIYLVEWDKPATQTTAITAFEGSATGSDFPAYNE